MSDRELGQQPLRQTRSKTELPNCLMAVACGAVMATASGVSSQQAKTPYEGQRDVFPEVILAPMQASGSKAIDGRWILIFRNSLAGPNVPDVEIQEREVTFARNGGQPETATISWEIVRTRNDICIQAGSGPCPDEIRVLSVPEGFQAVPPSAWVGEGTIESIRIVPVLIG